MTDFIYETRARALKQKVMMKHARFGGGRGRALSAGGWTTYASAGRPVQWPLLVVTGAAAVRAAGRAASKDTSE